MRLIDLDPQFHRYETRDGREHLIKVDTLAEAQGLQLDCPKCQPYPHGVIVTFRDRGALDHQGSQTHKGKPSRWAVSGRSFEDLTLQPSIDCTHGGGCTWHGFITNGDVT
jgi:hypothetical protein